MTLAQLLADPSRLERLDPTEARLLLPQASALVLALAVRAGEGAQDGTGPDRLLTVKEAAARLATSPDWVYRHAAQLGARRLGRALRFSSRALDAALASPPALRIRSAIRPS